MGGSYEAVPGTSPGDYGLIDPSGYSMLASQGIQNLQNVGQQGLNLNANPFANFIQDQQQLQDVTLGATSDLGRMLGDQTRQFTQQAVQDVGQQFSGLGALNSGAARDAAARRATQAAGQAATALGQQQLGLYGNLANQAFQNQQRQQNMYANMLGQGTGLGAQFGAPNYAAQQYAYQPGLFEQAGNFLGGIAPLAGGLLAGPAGAGIGAAIGGLFGGNTPAAQQPPQAPFAVPGGGYGYNQ